MKHLNEGAGSGDHTLLALTNADVLDELEAKDLRSDSARRHATAKRDPSSSNALDASSPMA